MDVLQPGDVLRHKVKTRRYAVIARRKVGDDTIPWPGWWVMGGGGLADHIIDRDWDHVGTIRGID